MAVILDLQYHRVTKLENV